MADPASTQNRFRGALVAPGGDDPSAEMPWGDCFEVDGDNGAAIPLLQITGKDFLIGGTIRYTGDMGLDGFDDITDEMKEQARTIDTAGLGKSDLASVPQFLRWFVGPYGRHTPAALIHDNLIEGSTPNGGVLQNDSASDRYFRFMLDSVEVPFTKRWIMWAATAMRTRWAVGGYRRALMVLWGLLAVIGISAAVMATVALVGGGDLPADAEEVPVLIGAIVLALVSGALFGKQWGAGVVAATAAPWLLPPTIIAVVGYLVYWVIERLLRAFGIE